MRCATSVKAAWPQRASWCITRIPHHPPRRVHWSNTGCAATEPAIRAGRGREKDKIVCRHSLARLNASMIKQKKRSNTGPPVAEEGDGAASEASERENREREEQLALLREERTTWGQRTRFLSSLFIFPWSSPENLSHHHTRFCQFSYSERESRSDFAQ